VARKLKVLSLCRVAKGLHGVQTQWIYFFRRLAKTEHTLFCLLSRKCLLEERLRELGVPFKVLPWCYVSRGLNSEALIRGAVNALAFPWIAHLAKRFDPDVIEGDINDYPLLRYLSKKTSAVIVCRVRSHNVFKRDLGDPSFVDKFIPLSRRLAAPLLRAGVPESKIEIINDGVDVRHFAPGDVPRTSPSLRVAIVGRIEPFKRILECLRIAHELKTGFEFFFAGANYRPEYFQEVMATRKALGLENICHFLEEKGDMPAFYRSIDVLLTLSGGSVMLEAMAMGKPVVAASPVSREEHAIVKHGKTGFLYGADDLTGVAEGLCELARSPELIREMGKAGREAAVRHFAIDDLIDRTLEVYGEAADVRRSAPLNLV